MEAPALNPTGGVKPKPPVPLDYKKDPTRPGGGVFVAHGKVAREGDFSGVPSGVVISSNSSDSGSDTGEAALGLFKSSVNDRNRPSLFSTSPFAPPLPNDQLRSPQSPSSLPPAHRGFGAASSIRSTVNMQQSPSQSSKGTASSSIVQFTPIVGRRSGSYSNVNPTLNMQAQQQPGNVQVMNVLDVPQGGNTIQEFALADTGFLEGIPGGMFDWGA